MRKTSLQNPSQTPTTTGFRGCFILYMKTYRKKEKTMAKVLSIISFNSDTKELYDGLSEGGGLTRTLRECTKDDFKFGIAKLYQMEKFEWVLEIDGKINGVFKTSKDARVALGAKMSLKALSATRGMYQKNVSGANK